MVLNEGKIAFSGTYAQLQKAQEGRAGDTGRLQVGWVLCGTRALAQGLEARLVYIQLFRDLWVLSGLPTRFHMMVSGLTGKEACVISTRQVAKGEASEDRSLPSYLILDPSQCWASLFMRGLSHCWVLLNTGSFWHCSFVQEVLSTILKADQEEKADDENGEASSAVCAIACAWRQPQCVWVCYGLDSSPPSFSSPTSRPQPSPSGHCDIAG